MNRLRIKHVTGFHYEGEVTASYNEARMLPVTSAGQLVLNTNLDIAPNAFTSSYVDYWGTHVTPFEILTPHQEMTLTATSLVESGLREHHERDLDWDALAEEVERATGYVEQLDQSPPTQPPDDVVAMARELAAGRLPCEAAAAICIAIGEHIAYVPGSTGVHTTASEAWMQKEGVCQDIAHLAIGALRAVGIPARYVSGYLHPDPEAPLGRTVVGESHAWVEWFCGDWRGFDPTNLTEIGDRHVAVGHGRHYSDVSPLRGVYAGQHTSTLFVTVEITREA